ncbi:hypothetical protein SAMN05444004_105153 [Jannaschia faecimaris]|uniref:SH3b domain-containing protein n=1 Tax=Jannaschia faecimaris TaxID=1244108 RepID=A0A1H3PT93_9RHOB|nr:SH3 domain-containing protein [Jannaschia faecimaris]SDZ04337.1 hypothetical protein SAMN05444004_105153 [Jannaschia faecimaris]
MKRMTFLLFLLCAAVAGGAQADPLRNTSRFGVDMRAGPGLQFPMIHVLDPGEVADRGRCDLGGVWCLLTAGGKVGWVDTRGLVPPRSGLANSDPIAPLRTAPIESSRLDDDGVRPLPDSIREAVNSASDSAETRRDDPLVATAPPGARVPVIFATDAPFYNVAEGVVNLRAGPGTDTDIVGELRPWQGGTIDICDAAQSWCRMTVDGGPVAWVKMTFMGLRRIEVPPLAPDDTAAR